MMMMMIIVMIRLKMTFELLIIMTVMLVLLMTWLCLENEVVALILLSKGSIFAFPPVNIKIKNSTYHRKITKLPKLSELVGIVDKYWQRPLSSNFPSNISLR